jgi:outer membrane protein TolC
MEIVMYQSIAKMAFCRLLAGVLLCGVNGVYASGLSIKEAEHLALKDDIKFKMIQARSASLSELAVAKESLPDPQLKLGFANLPTDSFNLGQEPMTQTVIGVRQMFPRGQTRALNTQKIDASVASNDAEAEDRQQQVLLAVRESYIRIYLQQQRKEILRQSLVVFSDLAEITRDYYASGRAHQQDVVQTQLEVAKVEERLSRIQQLEHQERARLAERIGAEAYRELDPQWPEISQPEPAQQIIAALPNHPKLRAWQYQVEKSRTSEDIARQAYKPGFAVDLAYGGRGGQNPDGSDRTDFLSVFVTMDVPLFTKNRQDRILASSIADTTATQYALDDIYRSMKARVEEYSTTLANERERLGLYQDVLLPQASFNAEAAFEAFQDAINDLTTLMRARIGEYELKLSHAALRADEIITRARLLYLQGEMS